MPTRPIQPKRKESMLDEGLTIWEVAELLKLAETTVHASVNVGELPAFNVRGQRRVRRTEFQRWMVVQPWGGADGHA
jgi:excisionase family DNA binding protein